MVRRGWGGGGENVGVSVNEGEDGEDGEKEASGPISTSRQDLSVIDEDVNADDARATTRTWTWLTYRSNSYARSRARVPWLKPVTYKVLPPRDMMSLGVWIYETETVA
jgi:hypothetical protein